MITKKQFYYLPITENEISFLSNWLEEDLMIDKKSDNGLNGKIIKYMNNIVNRLDVLKKSLTFNKPLKNQELSFKDKKKNLIKFINNSSLFETLADWQKDFKTTTRCKCGGSHIDPTPTDYDYSVFSSEFFKIKDSIKEL